MENTYAIIFFLLGLLQVIAIGLTSWALLTLVRVLERLAKIEGKVDEFPLAQVASNRHRIENIERAMDLHTEQIANIRQRCAEFHQAKRA